MDRYPVRAGHGAAPRSEGLAPMRIAGPRCAFALLRRNPHYRLVGTALTAGRVRAPMRAGDYHGVCTAHPDRWRRCGRRRGKAARPVPRVVAAVGAADLVPAPAPTAADRESAREGKRCAIRLERR